MTAQPPPKPDRIFDRAVEWRHLGAFASRAGGPVQLGIVSGRRRQGKTFLLEELARQTGGLYFGATEATETESLLLFARALAGHLGLASPPRFDGWDDAVRYLFATSRTGTAPAVSSPQSGSGIVVIDEFPYLSGSAPGLPSIIQRELDQAVTAGTGPSLLLCGSAMSVMGKILSGSAPLRGRANLELVVRPFAYPLAARFWGVGDPALAVRHHAVVGGTPAYRRFVNDDAPADLDDFDAWVLRTVLDPATPLFREARYLLEEETDVRDTALYHSVLSAVANGNHTRGGIAGYVGRKAADIGHHLNVLEDSGLLSREPDVFRQGRSSYRVAEPLLVFYQVVMRPRWGLLESGRAAAVWHDARPRFAAQVLGPHFEWMCREFAATADGLFRELPGEVGHGVVADPARRRQLEIDVVVLAPAVPGEPRRVLSLGEAKWGEVMTARHVERLGRARGLLAARGYDTTETVLACYSGAGFDPTLAAHAAHAAAHGDPESDEVLLVGLDRLYGHE